MWHFIFKKEEPYLKLFIDFRSASVGGALALCRKNQAPEILYHYRSYIKNIENKDSQNFVKEIFLAFDEVMKKISIDGIKTSATKNCSKKITTACCALSSPWYQSKIKNINVNSKKTIRFTKKILETILNNAEKNALFNGNISNKKGQIEKNIVSIKLNDYQLKNPFGKMTNSISLSFYESSAEEKLLEKIENQIKKYFHVDDVKFYTHPYMIINTVKSLFSNLERFLFLDLGGETIDIGLIDDTRLDDLITIPVGTNFFRKTMGDTLDIGSLLDKNIVSDENINKKNKLNKIKIDFISKLNDGLKNKWNDRITPTTIFVSTDNETTELIKNIISSKDFYEKGLKMHREPNIIVINKTIFNNISNNFSNTQEDPLLLLSANFDFLSTT